MTKMQVLWTVTGIPAVTMVTTKDRYFAVTVPFIGVDSWNISLSPCQRGYYERGSVIMPL